MIRLAYIVPTIGRPSLVATLDSLRAPAIIVADTDGDVVAARKIAAAHGHAVADDVHGMGQGYGNAQRNRGLAIARELGYTHVAYMDDDDVATPHAAERIMLGVVASAPTSVHLFRMRLPSGETVWRDETLCAGNLGVPCIVHPTDALSRWQDAYQGDILIATDLARELGRIVWHTPVVCAVRGQRDDNDTR